MKVHACHTLSFRSNAGFYRIPNGNNIGTYTKMFRADLDWDAFTRFFVKNFRNKDKVQFLQFASSDGSEAYTQIITLLENHDNIEKFLPIKAYDIDKNICNAAKSGFINITKTDKKKFADQDINFNKYFKKSPGKLYITNDSLEGAETYSVSEPLSNNVIFNHGDMKDVLLRHEDNSNSIILCRNMLYYLTDREIDYLTTLAAYKLNKGSLFAIGETDEGKAEYYLKRKGFEKVLHNVYRQT